MHEPDGLASQAVIAPPQSGDATACRALDIPGFLRLFQLRSTQIMWFLGAGASRSAGIKTAGDMIWDFKQRLYRSQRRLPPSVITDIGEPAVQRKLQAHFDALGKFPPAGSETEYSAYFEATYHAPRDRRAYLDELVARGKPSFGHLALALLMAEKLCRIVWTTNFDRTLEDAAANLLGGTGHLVTGDLGDPEKIRRALEESRWPVYGKLHGDYHSEALKNTDAELREQDGEMRRSLVDSCRRNGLAVIGYSGRDASVMEAFGDALDDGRGFPGGLFWFKRSQDEPFRAVSDLMERARALGIDAHVVEAEAFDELFVDLIRYLPQTADKMQSLDSTVRPRLANTRPRKTVRTTPAIRTNALAVVSRPAMCRLVDCTIGGYKAIEEAIAAAEVDIVARRSRQGVLAFAGMRTSGRPSSHSTLRNSTHILSRPSASSGKRASAAWFVKRCSGRSDRRRVCGCGVGDVRRCCCRIQIGSVPQCSIRKAPSRSSECREPSPRPPCHGARLAGCAWTIASTRHGFSSSRWWRLNCPRTRRAR